MKIFDWLMFVAGCAVLVANAYFDQSQLGRAWMMVMAIAMSYSWGGASMGRRWRKAIEERNSELERMIEDRERLP